MPDNVNQKPTVDQETDETPEPINFEEWLAAQPENARAAYEQHTGGLKSALQKEREANKAHETEKAKAERERQEQERAQMEQQGQFKELAEAAEKRAAEAEAKIAELTPVTERVTRLEAVVKGYLDTERKDLPAHVTALLDKLDVTDQLEWIAANRDALSKQRAGIPATPDPKHRLNANDEERRKRAWKPRL